MRIGIVLAFGLLLLPYGLLGDQAAVQPSRSSALPADVVRATQRVSQAIFAAQRQEREVAREAGLEELEQEIERLRSAVQKALDSSVVAEAPTQGAQALAADVAPEVAADLAVVRAKRESVVARLPKIESDRVRSVVQAAVERVAVLEGELSEVSSKPRTLENKRRLREIELKLDPTWSRRRQHRVPVQPVLQVSKDSALRVVPGRKQNRPPRAVKP